jgi:dinuclear metal center YbgI/SA1388 family protein
MTAVVSDIMRLMDEIAPPALAEDWDNAGLQIGDQQWTVRKVGVALDASMAVINAACQQKVDMLVTHHPLIFSPLKCIDCQTPIGAIVQKAIEHRISIFAAHTNFDKSEGGLNDILARRIGLLNSVALDRAIASTSDKMGDPHQGIGRIGDLPKAFKLQEFAAEIKQRLRLDTLKIVGRPDLVITRAAVCTGSGSSLVNAFLSSSAQVYISGDLRYHDAKDVEAADLSLIDIGHFPSEYLMVDALVNRLAQMVSQNQLEVIVQDCGEEIDPFVAL